MIALLLAGYSLKLPYDLWSIAFANQSNGLLIATSTTSKEGEEENEYQNRFYYSSIWKPGLRMIAKGSNGVLSHDGRTLALERGNTIDLVSVPSGKRLHTNIGANSVCFSPDDKLMAFTRTANPREVCIADAKTGKVRRLRKFEKSIKRPKPKVVVSHWISGWTRRGLMVEITYFTKGYEECQVGTYVDALHDRLIGTRPAITSEFLQTKFGLSDGSFVYDAKDEDEMDGIRLVRVAKGKRTVIFKRDNLSAGHEMGAYFAVAQDRILVYGATNNEAEERSTGYIWEVNPWTSRSRPIVSGNFTQPPGADGNSMFVALSQNGNLLAYGDFLDHRKVNIKRLGPTAAVK